jgi:hypothetical protein
MANACELGSVPSGLDVPADRMMDSSTKRMMGHPPTALAELTELSM